MEKWRSAIIGLREEERGREGERVRERRRTTAVAVRELPGMPPSRRRRGVCQDRWTLRSRVSLKTRVSGVEMREEERRRRGAEAREDRAGEGEEGGRDKAATGGRQRKRGAPQNPSKLDPLRRNSPPKISKSLRFPVSERNKGERTPGERLVPLQTSAPSPPSFSGCTTTHIPRLPF